MKNFSKEFRNLSYVIEKAQKVLLFAHFSPDSDTIGANLALKEYLLSLGKEAVVVCFDPIPKFLEQATNETFEFPDHLDLSEFDAVIACDSVEHGFHKIQKNLSGKQVAVLIDHHPDINIEGDITIIDADYSSACEIVFDYFKFAGVPITKTIATYIMMGILGDTGSFQHSNTTARVMEISSELMKKGASIAKIANALFANKKFTTLKLWGKAFEKAKINPGNGMIVTVLTKKDIEECGSSTEDIAQLASILNTVPGTKFSLILSEKGDGKIKGSLRSEKYKGVDVSEIAHKFGGGGHRLASGFEVEGKIVETKDGWTIA